MASGSDTPSHNALQQRRGGARFARVLVEPSRTAALLARSPVNPDAAAAPSTAPTVPPRPLTSQHQRSTPQPVRRTLFSRLFRAKARDANERAVSVSAAASPSSSHQSTPTHRDSPAERQAARGSARQGMMTTAASSHDVMDRRHDDHLAAPDIVRAVSMPYHPTKTTRASVSEERDDTAIPKTRTLAEGRLVKLSSHKYWHAKATYFIVEEASSSVSEARSRVWLRQFRKTPKAELGMPHQDFLFEIELTESDVVVDISDRYIKHGLELFHRSPPREPSGATIPHDEYGGHLNLGSDLFSLRLSADDAVTHRKWMRVLGSAVARLIDQSKRHYPITPADVEFKRGTLKAFEPQAVTAIVGTAIPIKSGANAKVRPLMSAGSSSSDEDEVEVVVPENQGELLQLEEGFGDRQDEMRNPEEPEIHSDCGDDGLEGRQSSLSADSRAFSDAWASPHHDNNNNDYCERSSNQLDEDDDDDEESHSQRPSECYRPSDVATVAFASVNMTQVSPTGTASVASTPSPRPVHNSSQDQVAATLSTMMEAASLEADECWVATPPSSPSSASKTTASERQYPLATSSRMGGTVMRPHVHSFNANGQVFTLDVRYRLLKSIGNGAYGAVIAASDSIHDMSVAVKKITNIFDDLVDAKRILREVRLLRHFHHKNITQLLDLAPPATKKSFEDMYIITELMETDLHQVIYSMQPMSDDHVKYFLYQMLCALYHIHSAGVLHRDMKPSNILLNSNCDLKVCDFGLARGGMDVDTDARKLAQPGDLTEYVVTRWYRAPEIMLNCLQYTAAIDVWAVGCIFAEMLLREPLFPGNDYMHQLKLIIKFLGTPKQDDISFIKNAKALRFLTKLSISKPKKWREVFTGDELNPLALDLLAQMLIFNPAKRISVEKALQHPYLATFYDPADITRASPFAFDFDLPDDKLTKEALVDLLCEDVACFHPAVMQSMKQPSTASVPMPMLPRPPLVATPNGGNRYFGTTASAS